MSHDRKFLDTFLLILGALVLFSVAMIVLSKVIGGRQQAFISEDPEVIAQLEERIKPFGEVVIEGQEEPAAQELKPSEPAPVAATTTVAVPSAPTAEKPQAAISGENVYNSACMACHSLGIAGAPKVGDAAQWTARIESGMDALYSNAINGYQGAAGVMPAKGGRIDLSDEAVRAAVDYMVNQSQ